jgi:hypothetical protein
MNTWKPRPGERAGPGWKLTTRDRHLVVDVNHWKSFLAERARTPSGAAGCLALFDPGPGRSHKMLADHWAAEYPVEAKANGRTVDEWKERPGRDNDLFDCAVGAAVAASVGGLAWRPGGAAPPRPKKPGKSWAESQREQMAGRGRVPAGGRA